jgi:16S rRNA (uracil1498-N3)-methyltransferase
MARFFLPHLAVQGNQAMLTGSELHHLRNVLRLREGDRVTLFDDQGQEHEGVIQRLSSSAAEVSLLQSFASSPPAFSLILAQGLLKSHKMDLVVEKATELGVSRILPFVSSFTLASLPPAKQKERIARWQRVARSAAKQCGRKEIPGIEKPVPFTDLVSLVAQDMPRLLLWEKEGQASLKDVAHDFPSPLSLLLVVGPEGGLAAEEVACARTQGFSVVSLGKRILRAETAGIVAVALCQFLWGDLGTPPGLDPGGR